MFFIETETFSEELSSAVENLSYRLQKLTLLDYPGKVACTLFSAGCNFRCPFCHNASLVTGNDDGMEVFTREEILKFLQKRQGTGCRFNLVLVDEHKRADEAGRALVVGYIG